MRRLRNVTLEMSLKPFYSLTDEFIDATLRHAFTQWLPLLKNAEQVSMLLWTADGSEILQYQGDLGADMEWAKWIGGVHNKVAPPNDPEGKSIHTRPYLYREDPVNFTYRDLKRIVAAIKRVGHEVTGLPVKVGETFDPGSEFARSKFKYEWHNEICLADTGGPKTFACCYATLNGDDRQYAGWPGGIPDGTPLGQFLGRQAKHLLGDCGFDYLWFSNGFGFGLETWMTRGPLFDGRKFDASQANAIREKIVQFWKLFRQECPDFEIQTRGTNLSTGIDLASDGVPLRDIYDGGYNLQPPPNSPWAALNGDFGIELTGWMSHIAELPKAGSYPFRFYAHDPWWHNSPWLDRYGREPHDIYLPMSVSRIDAEGAVRNPDSVLLLTIDDSWGRMPDQVPQEVIPHLHAGLREAPDQPGPLVWVYPFDEYHAMTFGENPRLEQMFAADWFVRSAVRNGLPLNTVVSTRSFLQHSVGQAFLPATRRGTPRPVRPGEYAQPWQTGMSAPPEDLYRQSVIVTPVPDGGTELSKRLIDHVKQGGRVLLYGPLRHADPALLQRLGVKLAAEISGTVAVQLHGCPDDLDRPYPTKMEHRPIMNAGGYEVASADGTVLATIAQGSERRVAALAKGGLAWVRGTSSSGYVGGDLISGAGHLPRMDDPAEYFEGDLLMRYALAEIGGPSLTVKKQHSGQPNPILTVHRHDNAFFFSGFVPDTTVEHRLRFPQGAPILLGCDAQLIAGHACYRMPRAWHRECRLFVEQQSGVVSCHEKTAESMGLVRRLRITGLENATLRLYPPNNQRQPQLVINGSYPYYVGPFAEAAWKTDGWGRYMESSGLTGELVVSW